MKGWFQMPGQDGDRTLDQQLVGLEGIDWKDKTVLDLGCAEGLICAHALYNGAKFVTGVDVVERNVETARAVTSGMAEFVIADLNEKHDLGWKRDIVLMLGILHKLRDPTAAVKHYSRFAAELIVVRLPPGVLPYVVLDARSGKVPHNIRDALYSAGWQYRSDTRGTFDEWIGFYERLPR